MKKKYIALMALPLLCGCACRVRFLWSRIMKNIAVIVVLLTFTVIRSAYAECTRTEKENEEAWLKLDYKTICGCLTGNGSVFSTPEDNLKLVSEGKDAIYKWKTCDMMVTLSCSSSVISVFYSNDRIYEEMSRYDRQLVCINGNIYQGMRHPEMWNPHFVMYAD